MNCIKQLNVPLIALFLVFSSTTFSQNWVTYHEETPITVEYLEISDLSVTQIPNLSRFVNLKGLKFYNIRGVLNELKGLQGLEIEEMNITASEINAQFWKQITSLKQLHKLTISDVRGGELFGKDIKKLKYLTYLKLELVGEKLNTYSNYKYISKLKRLSTLDLQGNFLKTFNGDLNQFKHNGNLKIIIIDGNCVSESYYKTIKESLTPIRVINDINC